MLTRLVFCVMLALLFNVAAARAADELTCIFHRGPAHVCNGTASSDVFSLPITGDVEILEAHAALHHGTTPAEEFFGFWTVGIPGENGQALILAGPYMSRAERWSRIPGPGMILHADEEVTVALGCWQQYHTSAQIDVGVCWRPALND